MKRTNKTTEMMSDPTVTGLDQLDEAAWLSPNTSSDIPPVTEERAEQVQSTDSGGRLGEHRLRRGDHRDADRDVDEEHPPPARIVGK